MPTARPRVTIVLPWYVRGQHTQLQAAKLNFGDCFSYALAKSVDEPLLFKGNDFSHTDIPRVSLEAEKAD